LGGFTVRPVFDLCVVSHDIGEDAKFVASLDVSSVLHRPITPDALFSQDAKLVSLPASHQTLAVFYTATLGKYVDISFKLFCF
jgi:hypothetical protein